MKQSNGTGPKTDNYELKEDPAQKSPDAIETATRLISYKEWTKNALTERLQKRGCTDDDIEEAMIWLEDQGLIDDRKYAFEFASGRMRTRRWGIIKISAELKKRGINSRLAEEATASLKGKTEEAAALAALQKWLRIKQIEPPLKRDIAIKASSHLRSKGFTGQAISFAMNKGQDGSEEEYPDLYED